MILEENKYNVVHGMENCGGFLFCLMKKKKRRILVDAVIYPVIFLE